jgi:hypothetical protein
MPNKKNLSKKTSFSKPKSQKNKRQGQIYSHFKQQLNKLDKAKHPQYFTPYLDLEIGLLKHLKKLKKQYPQHDFEKEF